MSGIVGIVSNKDCKNDLLYATDYHSHLGTEYGGIALYDQDNLNKPEIHEIRSAQFKSKFFEDIHFLNLNGNRGIGAISDSDVQPLVLNSKFGQYAICGTGYINNGEALTRKLVDEGAVFSEMLNGKINQIELAGKLINKGKNLEDGIEYMFDQIKGSISLLLLGKEGLYAVRDRYGRTPLVLAEKEGSKVVAFESCSYKNLGFKTKKFLGPGEIILLDENKEIQIKKQNDNLQLCTFLFVYTGFPAAEYEGKKAEAFRERFGRVIASNDKIKADFVDGVADSGLAYAFGYAKEANIPLKRSLLKYTPGWARSYMPPEQGTRDLIAKMKQIVVEEIVKGQKIVITEDSIVRGTQLKNFLMTKLWGAGAKEIHVRPACPPLMYPCPYLLATKNLDELFIRKIAKRMDAHKLEIDSYFDFESEAHKRMIEAMEKDLTATSLVYPKLDDMLSAVELPKEDLCTYCWTGKENYYSK